jgi:hypothetical protein
MCGFKNIPGNSSGKKLNPEQIYAIFLKLGKIWKYPFTRGALGQAQPDAPVFPSKRE